MSSRPPLRDDLPVPLVDDGLLGRELAGIDAEEAQVADELVGKRLEHLGDELGPRSAQSSTVVGLVAGALGGGPFRAPAPATGEVARDGIEQFGDADVLVLFGSGAKDRNQGAGRQGVGQSLGQLLGVTMSPSTRYFSIRASSLSTMASTS